MTESPRSIGDASQLTAVLRCLACGSELSAREADLLGCPACGATYRVEMGTVRMLPTELRDGAERSSAEAAVKSRTAESFAYEWSAFGQSRPEWRKNFVDYMQPHQPEFFNGLTVLDVGTG